MRPIAYDLFDVYSLIQDVRPGFFSWLESRVYAYGKAYLVDTFSSLGTPKISDIAVRPVTVSELGRAVNWTTHPLLEK